jgi:hypothetical protein
LLDEDEGHGQGEGRIDGDEEEGEDGIEGNIRLTSEHVVKRVRDIILPGSAGACGINGSNADIRVVSESSTKDLK